MVAVLLGAYHSAQETSQGEQGWRTDERYRGRYGRWRIEIGDSARDPANTTVRESNHETGL